MRHIFIIFLIALISACGDNPLKISNKGGVITKSKEYTFYMMEIDSIKATPKISEARYCADVDACWRLMYEGDLSDYENGQLVNITIKDLKISSIDSVWFPTKWGFYIFRPFFGYYNSIFIAKYLFFPIVTIFFFVLLIGLFPNNNENKNTDEAN